MIWSGWGGNKKGSGFQTNDQSGLALKDIPRLKLKWAFGFPNSSMVRSQPAILGEVLYVGGAEGAVYALDTKSGCVYWHVETDASVRGAIVLGSLMLYSFNTIADERSLMTVDGTGNFGSKSNSLHIDNHEQKRIMLEASHEKRDNKKVDRFAHEARVQAAKYERQPKTNLKTVY